MFQIFVQIGLKVLFLYNSSMNYEHKLALLRHYEILKTLGYEYCENFDLEPQSMSHNNLPNDIDSLHNIVSHCTLCQYAKNRKNVLFGYGNTQAKVMFVGDCNSIMEDSNGQFYIDKTGELLKNMIEKVLHIKKEEVYITNVLKCLPLNPLDISKNEVNICKEYLYKQIEIINPKIIVTLGDKAYNYLTNDTDWSKIRGNVIKHKNYTILPMYHPNMILRNPTLKKEAYAHMLKLNIFLNESE